MLVSDIATRVKRSFGDEVGAQITDADIMRWINDGMREIALANNLLQVKATAAAVSGQAEYHIPSNCLTIHTLKYAGNKLVAISMQDADNLLTTDALTQTGTPTSFYQWAGNLILFPKPNANDPDDIQLFYTREPNDVVTTADTPELPIQYHQRILEYCMAQAAYLDADPQAYMLKMNEFKGNTQEMKDNSDWNERDAYPNITVSPRDYGTVYEDVGVWY